MTALDIAMAALANIRRRCTRSTYNLGHDVDTLAREALSAIAANPPAAPQDGIAGLRPEIIETLRSLEENARTAAKRLRLGVEGPATADNLERALADLAAADFITRVRASLETRDTQAGAHHD